MTAPISNGPTTHGYTTMRDATLLQGNTRRQREAWKAIKALVEQDESYSIGVGSRKIFNVMAIPAAGLAL